MNNLKTTNILLLIIAVPVLVFVLITLKFIFIPLVFAMFISLLFIPLLRKLKRKGLPKLLRVLVVLAITSIAGFLVFQVVSLSSQEILSTKDTFFKKAEERYVQLESLSQEKLGFSVFEKENKSFDDKRTAVLKYTKSISLFLIGFIPQVLTALFFVILLLFESFDFEKLLNSTILKKRFTSIKAFTRIEKEIVKFLNVKFLISLGTGIGTSLVCYAFDISFPIFWGLFAFAINFIQMVGSIISIIMCTIFAFIELELGTTLLYFALGVTAVQVVFGSILEPIFMGKSFSINIVVVLVMLMFWGFVWDVPGLILSIPITVFLKIILEQFEKTKTIARLMQ